MEYFGRKDLTTKDTIDAVNTYRLVLNNLLSNIFVNGLNSRELTLIGFCYKKLGNYKKAISFFEKAVLVDKTNFSAFYEMGICAFKENKNCIALNSFINAIQAKPDNLSAILNLGISHELCEEDDMALMIYERLIETNPEYKNGYLYKAELLIKFSRYNDAIEVLRQGIEYNPNSVELYSRLGFCYKMLGKNESAYQSYKKVLKSDAPNKISLNAIKEMRKIRKNNDKKLKFVICNA